MTVIGLLPWRIRCVAHERYIRLPSHAQNTRQLVKNLLDCYARDLTFTAQASIHSTHQMRSHADAAPADTKRRWRTIGVVQRRTSWQRCMLCCLKPFADPAFAPEEASVKVKNPLIMNGQSIASEFLEPLNDVHDCCPPKCIWPSSYSNDQICSRL